MTRYGSVYIITNTVTKEQYVGQTRQVALRRWKTHINTANSKVAKKYRLALAICEFGDKVFEFQELYCAFDANSLNQAEMYFIETMSPAYNIAKGGAGHRGVVASESVRKMRSDRLKNLWADPDWRNKQCEIIKKSQSKQSRIYNMKKFAHLGNVARWNGHVKNPKTVGNVSESIKKSWQDPVVRQKRIDGIKKTCATFSSKQKRRLSILGRKMSDESIEKSARAKWKPVYCKELECSFLSQKYAAEFLGVLRTSVTNAVKRKGKVGGVYTLEKVA